MYKTKKFIFTFAVSFLCLVSLISYNIPDAKAQAGPVQNFVQNYGNLSSTAGCTASTGVATSSTISPCGGQGSMFQNSLVSTHTLSWTAVAGTGAVSACTVQLEQATTLTGSYTALGTAQTCTSSGTYTTPVASIANYVRINVTALTTTQNAYVNITYFGNVGNTPANVLASFISCGTATACSPTYQVGARLVYGSCTASAATTCTVTAISPPFTSSTSYFCAASDATTQANGAFKLTYNSSTSFTITTTSSSDTFNWMCWGI